MKRIGLSLLIVLVVAVAGSAFAELVGLRTTTDHKMTGCIDKKDAVQLSKLINAGDKRGAKSLILTFYRIDPDSVRKIEPGESVFITEEPSDGVIQIKLSDGSLWWVRAIGGTK